MVSGKKSIIGYAQADFKTMITDNRLYIDRTAFLETMENHSNTNLVLVRPRRFGKSLWLSVLHYYYGLEHKDKFNTLFGHLAVGKNPTPLHNTFMILRMQFAGIDVETDAATFSGFRANVRSALAVCMSVYSDCFSVAEKKQVETIETPADMIQTFFELYKSKKIPHPLYILIDEYDQFANELRGLDFDRFQSVVGLSASFMK